jgi:hypothetical protein
MLCSLSTSPHGNNKSFHHRGRRLVARQAFRSTRNSPAKVLPAGETEAKSLADHGSQIDTAGFGSQVLVSSDLVSGGSPSLQLLGRLNRDWAWDYTVSLGASVTSLSRVDKLTCIQGSSRILLA